MKILFVSQYFYPENFRINDLACRLVERGHEVHVLTGIPNYPRGEFFEGYGIAKKRRELWNGVKIMRVPVFPRYNDKVHLCINYLSFVIFGCLKALTMSKADYDVIYAFGTSPITQALPALVMKKRSGARVIVNVQDLWPDNVVAITGLENKKAIRLLDKMVDYIYNRCDVVLGTSHSFVDAIRKRKGLREKRKVGYWPQYAVVEPTDEKRTDLLPEGIFHIVFTGNVGDGQGLENVIDAIGLLREKGVDNFCFDIVGDGRARERLETLSEHKGFLGKYIKFHGSFPENEIPGILACADASLLILNPDPVFERTIPAKLQTYLVCSTPVIGCVSGEAKHILEKYNAGICADKVSGEALAEAILAMMNLTAEEREELKANAKRLSDEEFDREKLIDKLEKYMRLLCRY